MAHMPLAIYRRHAIDCQFYGRPGATRGARIASARSGCKALSAASTCAVAWTSSRGRPPRISSAGWEASGEVGIIRADIPAIGDAVERFFDDAKARGLSEATVGKQNVLLRKQFLPWCRTRGLFVEANRRG